MSRKFDAASMSGREWAVRTAASTIGLAVALLGLAAGMASLFVTFQEYQDSVAAIKLLPSVTAGVIVTAFGAPACGAWIMTNILKLFGLKPLQIHD